MSETTTERGATFAPLSQSLKWAAFRSAVLFVAAITDRTRGALPFASAVLVEVGTDSVALVATDRYRLHTVELDASHDLAPGRFMLPAADLLAAVKPARVTSYALTLGAESWALTVDGTTTSGRYVPADFPQNWRGLFFDDARETDILHVSPALVAGTFAAISKAYGASAPARVTLNGSGRAFMVDGFAPDARALVMPRRAA